jgi:hypothetical protein
MVTNGSSVEWMSSAFFGMRSGSVTRAMTAVANAWTTTTVDTQRRAAAERYHDLGALSALLPPCSGTHHSRRSHDGAHVAQGHRVTGMGGQFGIPEGVVFEPALVHSSNITNTLFQQIRRVGGIPPTAEGISPRSTYPS